MALLLIGMTASGKDTIAKILVEKYGMKKHVTYTTRPMRDGEVDGENYHFISQEQFIEKTKAGFFDEWTTYNVASGDIWYYGSNSMGVEDNTVMIVNPDGWRTYCHCGTTFYLTCDKNERLRRLSCRGDNYEEAQRRLAADVKDFKGFDEYADYIINSTNLTPEEIAERIYRIYAEETNISSGSNDCI